MKNPGIKTSTILFCLFIFCLLFNPPLSAQTIQPNVPKEEKKEEPAWIKSSLPKVPNISRLNDDPRITISEFLKQVKDGHMTPQEFFQKASRLPLEGKELRHVLMEIKRDIGLYRGKQGLEEIFGTQYKEGGSSVEEKLLGYRKKLVMDTLNQVMREFREKTQVDGKNFSVYYAEVGSWASESPRHMKFAGDIDFNLMSGNLNLANQMKQRFDALIRDAIGMTPEHLDAPCTVHGMATPEVFVGQHGQAFAEGAIKKVKRIDGASRSLDKIPFMRFDEALQNMHIEARFASNPLPDIKSSKWPTEPGITLEMLRHFDHDVMGKNVFTDLESFMKAAKYMGRSDEAVVDAGGKPSNQKLSEFCKKLTANKKSSTQTQADLIRAYFDSINKPIPLEIHLGPTQNGNTKIEANFKSDLIQGFWKDCQNAMWDNAYKGFDRTLGDLRNGMRSMGDTPEFAQRMDQMREMIEVEMRVLQDSQVGIKDFPASSKRFMNQVGEFRSLAKAYFQSKAHIKTLPIEERNTYKFIEENLKRGTKVNIQLALGALINAPEKINDYIDILDNTLMAQIRGEKGDWDVFLKQKRELTWVSKTNQFLGRNVLSDEQISFMNKIERRNQMVEEGLVKILKKSATARGIQSVNQIFAQSVRDSKVGQGSMKALTAINLAQEIPVYIDLVAKEDWSGLAAEFIIRRVPLGSAANNLYMGRYLLAVWDVGVTLVPPAALLELTYRISEWSANQFWDIYWGEELDKFIDDLYDDARFKLIGVEEVDNQLKLSHWQLMSVTYNGKEFNDIPGFIKLKQKHIEEMHAQCALPLSQREFPMRYTLDGISDWMKLGHILRENIVAQDPFLLLVEEMKKNPIAGEKLKEHYMDLWYTRFEEVKLAYIVHMIDVLEKRRSAEQAYLTGKLPAISKRLDQLAATLQITEEMQDQLEEEMGGSVYTFYTWIRDWAKGIKRSLSDEAGIWSHDKECVLILQKYLRAYDKIVKTRSLLETQLGKGEKGDFGLRILTGPLMLKGKPESDEKSVSQWIEIYKKAFIKNIQELTAIKNRHAGSSGLDPDPKSYDQRALGLVVKHDFWREVWMYLFRSNSKNDFNALDETKAAKIFSTIQSALSDKTDIQGMAKGNHAFHAKQRDKILGAFEAHYADLAAQEEDKKKKQEAKKKKEAKDNVPAFVKKSKDDKDSKDKEGNTPAFVKKTKEGADGSGVPAFAEKSTQQPAPLSKDDYEIVSVALETINVANRNTVYEKIKDINNPVIMIRMRGRDHIVEGYNALQILVEKGQAYYVKNIGYVVSERKISPAKVQEDSLYQMPKRYAIKSTNRDDDSATRMPPRYTQSKKRADNKSTNNDSNYKSPPRYTPAPQDTQGRDAGDNLDPILSSDENEIKNIYWSKCAKLFGDNCSYDSKDTKITRHRDYSYCQKINNRMEGFGRENALMKKGIDISRIRCQDYNHCVKINSQGKKVGTYSVPFVSEHGCSNCCYDNFND